MTKLSIEEMRQVYIDMLILLSDICEANGLEYYLAYGSLMGALRHKGFIPWDTDIDVFVTRETAVEISKILSKDSKYRVIIMGCGESRDADIGKVNYPSRFYIEDTSTIIPECGTGICLDGFIMDFISVNKMRIRNFFEKILYIKYKWGWASGYTTIKSVILNAIIAVIRIIPDFVIIKCMEKCNTSKDRAGYVRIPHKMPLSYSLFPVDWFSDKVMVVFEGGRYPAPSHYHEVMTQVYGDYMTPCPEWRRQRKLNGMQVAYNNLEATDHK